MTQLLSSKTARLVVRDFTAEARKEADLQRNSNAEELADVETAVTRATLLLRREVRRAA
ncbi:MAG: hypothetical protein WD845_18010 [Pirellulales bacterium]